MFSGISVFVYKEILIGIELQFYKMKRVMGMDGGNSFTTI